MLQQGGRIPCVIREIKGRALIRFTNVWHLHRAARRCASVASSAPVNTEPQLSRTPRRRAPAPCVTELVHSAAGKQTHSRGIVSVERGVVEDSQTRRGTIPISQGFTYAAVLSWPVNHRVVVRRVSRQSESAAGDPGLILPGISSPIVPVPAEVGPSLLLSVKQRASILRRARVHGGPAGPPALTELGQLRTASPRSPERSILTQLGLPVINPAAVTFSSVPWCFSFCSYSIQTDMLGEHGDILDRNVCLMVVVHSRILSGNPEFLKL